MPCLPLQIFTDGSERHMSQKATAIQPNPTQPFCNHHGLGRYQQQQLVMLSAAGAASAGPSAYLAVGPPRASASS